MKKIKIFIFLNSLMRLLFIYSTVILLCASCSPEPKNNQIFSNTSTHGETNMVKNINPLELQNFITDFVNNQEIKLDIWHFPRNSTSLFPITYQYLKDHNYGYRYTQDRDKLLEIINIFKNIATNKNIVQAYQSGEVLIETRTVFQYSNPNQKETIIIYISQGLEKNHDDIIQFKILKNESIYLSEVFYAKNLDSIINLVNQIN